jgi:hypothetical protein
MASRTSHCRGSSGPKCSRRCRDNSWCQQDRRNWCLSTPRPPDTLSTCHRSWSGPRDSRSGWNSAHRSSSRCRRRSARRCRCRSPGRYHSRTRPSSSPYPGHRSHPSSACTSRRSRSGSHHRRRSSPFGRSCLSSCRRWRPRRSSRRSLACSSCRPRCRPDRPRNSPCHNRKPRWFARRSCRRRRMRHCSWSGWRGRRSWRRSTPHP